MWFDVCLRSTHSDNMSKTLLLFAAFSNVQSWSYLCKHMYNNFQTSLPIIPLVSPFSLSLSSSLWFIKIGEPFLRHPVHRWPFTCFPCCNSRIYELIWVWLNMCIAHTNVSTESLHPSLFRNFEHFIF